MSDQHLDHWDTRTSKFLISHLKDAEAHVRIATGYFTIQGYNLIGHHIQDVVVQVLVGFDEKDSANQLRAQVIADIEAHLSQWDIDNRREAVLFLVEKLRNAQFYLIDKRHIDIVDARIRKRDHGKVFIIDQTKVVNGSGNLTQSGLLYNYEAETVVIDPQRVQMWVSWFDEYWNAPNTYDLTQALLDALVSWLELSRPYDIYLKTIQALVRTDDKVVERSSYLMPVHFQQVVIERVMRQLLNWRGALLVASTGLGKTVMATHVAYRLMHREQQIMNVIVFAPRATKLEWKKRLKTGGITPEIFTLGRLDQPKRYRDVIQIIEALEDVDDKYLIIVDESHYFKNRLRSKDGDQRYSFQRLVDVVNSKHPYILLLTATPIAKDISDLDNQLYLLPHNAPKRQLATRSGQLVFEGFIPESELPSTTAWQLQSSDNFFDEFKDLPISTVISTSQVAKDFAEHTDVGDFVMFGDTKRWIPEIALRRVRVSVPLEEEITDALNRRYFHHRVKSFKNRGRWQRSESTIVQHVNLAWASSPLALSEVLRKTIDDEYSVSFVRSQSERQDRLQPILDTLQQQAPASDEKFMTLCHLLSQFKQDGRKVIVFVELLATAYYIDEMLKQVMPEISVANVVCKKGSKYDQKHFEKEVLPLIYDFAPEANAEKIEKGHEAKHYDVFVTTDAYGVGINLQDASVVISYDLAWTADVIIQRAGRVLRFSKRPVKVFLYVFTGVFTKDIVKQRASKSIDERLERLTSRTRRAEKFSELPMIPTGDSAEFTTLSGLTNSTLEDLGDVDITLIEEFSGVSRFLQHISELKQNSAYVDALKDDISSAMYYAGKSHLIYILMRYRGRYVWTIMDIKHRLLLDYKEDALLNTIQCTLETPIADSIGADLVEEYAQVARSLWCKENNIASAEDVERVCALYLCPDVDKGSIGDMLSQTLR